MPPSLEPPLAAFLERFRSILLAVFGEDLISLALYGSYARGAATPESDIDLLAVVEDGSADPMGRAVTASIQAERTAEYASLKKGGWGPVVSCPALTRKEAIEFHWIYLDMVQEALLLHDKDHFLKNRLQELGQRLHALGSRKSVLPDGSWYWDLKPGLQPGEVIEL
ncbi:MAG: nucleotidyltransferase domain-containing protein [Elusimicrobia bacterium]|nr:nucleotidyltransferase domain-containing protein [Elusimicrobiota bacterium]